MNSLAPFKVNYDNKNKNNSFIYLFIKFCYNSSNKKEYLRAKQVSSKPDLIKKENKKIVMFSHDKAKSDFAIVSVYKSSNFKLKFYFVNNLQFKPIYTNL